MRVIHGPRRFRRWGWMILATILLAVILAVSAGAAITNLHAQGQPHYQSAVGTPVYLPSPTPTPKQKGTSVLPPSPISGPASTGVPPVLSANLGVVFAQGGAVYLWRSTDTAPQKLSTPGYTSLVAPIVTNNGHLLYAGTGLYLIDLLASDATPTPPLQIASIDPQKQVIASMAISPDGQAVFWSVEPHDGNGTISIYEAGLTSSGATTPALIYTQPANNCPCYMIFGLAGNSAAGTNSLLLTDNLGTPADQGTGLWLFDQTQQQVGTKVLAEEQGQAPLALSPDHTLLAFAPATGEVPEPTDSSVPAQVGSQPFGNSMAIVNANASAATTPTTIVAPQTNIHSFSSYHWITTPVFSSDNQAIAYIQFSSDDTGPYDRHSALYVAPTNGSSPPAVVASFSARLVELGSWVDSHTLLLYADNGIYAIDTQTAAIALLTPVQNYSSIIGLIHIPTRVNCNTQCTG